MNVHRTLVRVSKINADSINLVIPGWNPNNYAVVLKSELPAFVLSALAEKHRYFLCLCNIDAPTRKEIRFTSWEIAPEPKGLLEG